MGIGVRLKLVVADGSTQYNHVTTSTGYASSSDGRVHFGFGSSRSASAIEILWPSGVKQTLQNVAGDRVITIDEPRQ
jgi:enediyne biosynthesis protein E4